MFGWKSLPRAIQILRQHRRVSPGISIKRQETGHRHILDPRQCSQPRQNPAVDLLLLIVLRSGQLDRSRHNAICNKTSIHMQQAIKTGYEQPGDQHQHYTHGRFY